MNKQEVESLWHSMGGTIGRCGGLLYEDVLCGRGHEAFQDTKGRPLNSEESLQAVKSQASRIISEFEVVKAWWLTQEGATTQDDGDGETSFWAGDKLVASWWMRGALTETAIHVDTWYPGTPGTLKNILTGEWDRQQRLRAAQKTLKSCMDRHARLCQETYHAQQAMEAAQKAVKEIERES